MSDLCCAQAAAAAGEVSRICAELVFGYNPPSASGEEASADSSEFFSLQNKVAASLSGSRLAKDRAASTVAKVMIPEALDYPA
jgi:hypothetical protein